MDEHPTKENLIREIIEIKNELGISDQSIIKAVKSRGTASGLLCETQDHALINILKVLRNKLLIHYNTLQIEERLAAGASPTSESVTKGKRQRKRKSV